MSLFFSNNLKQNQRMVKNSIDIICWGRPTSRFQKNSTFFRVLVLKLKVICFQEKHGGILERIS